ncbi:MAG: TonB-dependent receptor [Gammaproteobacteria bacterium]|nr:TonB-dependent receptor [Gammaproteobacteria bacterium]
MGIIAVMRFTIGRLGSWGVLALLAFGFTVIGKAPASVAAEDAGSGLIEEIVVTSRRRQESQQDVPLSVTAFGAEQIDQIKPQTLRDFDGFIPNMYIGMNTAGPGASALYVRGVGYPDIEKTQSPQVGVIVDGIQIGSSTGQLIDTFDVESIEVNRGPQGVLFGKNTIGGNVVVNRVRPQFNETGARLSAELGNFDSRIIKGRINIPLIDDSLALKVGAVSRERDGFYDNITLGDSAGDVDFASYTAALRWAPTDSFDAILTYDRIRDRSQIPPQDPRFNGDDPFENLADKKEPTNYDVDQVGLRAQWELGNGYVINSITGYHAGDDKVNQDFDGGSINGGASPFAQLHTLRDQQYDVFTQEVRLSGDFTDTVDFMAGIYYFDSELEFQQHTNNVLQVPFGLPPGAPCAAVIPTLRENPSLGNALCQFPNARSIQIAGEDVQSVAVFGAVNWRPVENLELSFGARYIDEEKDVFNSYFDYTTGTFDTGSPVQEFNFAGLPERRGTAYEASDSWDDLILQASATWAITDVNTAYVSYSEGFRSGGFSIRSARDPNEAAFDPEDAFQVEVGLKNEFFERRLRVNLAYFHLERDGAQFSSIITLPPGSIPGTTTIINNGGTTEHTGVELESQWLINEDFTLVVNGGILDTKNEAFTIDCHILDGCTAGGVLGADPRGTLRTLGGNSDSRQPDWNVSVTLAFARQIGSGMFSANVGWKKVGDFLLVNTGGGADQRLYEGGYFGLDARVAYEWTLDNGNTLAIAAFGKNLTDEEWREQALFLGGFQTGFQGWGAPQTYAVELSYSM